MRYFKAYELVPPEVYKQFGELSEYLIDSGLRRDLDALRKFIDMPIVVNNWKWGGQFQYRGFRPFDCKEGNPVSMHKLGCAIDCHCPHLTAEELRQIIINNQSKFKHTKRIEADVNWLHIDTKKTGLDCIYLFKQGE